MRAILVICCVFLGALSAFGQKNRPLGTRDFNEVEKNFEEIYPEELRTKGSGWKPNARWIEHQSHFKNGEGLFMNATTILNRELADWDRANPAVREGGEVQNTGYWTNLGAEYYNADGGWNPGVGRVNCMLLDPNDDETIYVGTPSGGLWRSTDNGQSWLPLTDGMASIGVSGIAVSPENSDEIYILTGDGDGRDTWSTGVLKSEDGGVTWQPTALSFGEDETIRAFALEMNPLNAQQMYAATEQGVYMTTDGWQSFTQHIANEFCFDIEFKPDNPQTVYVATDSLVVISYDGGLTFNQGQDVAQAGGVFQRHRQELAVSPAFPDDVFLYASSSLNGFTGVYRSSNAGVAWAPVSIGDPINGAPNIGNTEVDGGWGKVNTQAFYDHAFAIGPDANFMLTGGVNVWRKDLGVNDDWEIRGYWNFNDQPEGLDYIHADVHELKYTGGYLYACTDGGIFRSTNDGDNWEDITRGLVIGQIYEMDSPVDDQSKTIAGFQDNGVNIIDQNTAPDMSHVQGSDGMYNRFRPTVPQTVYTSLFSGNIRSSLDGGLTWANVAEPSGAGRFVTPFEMIRTFNAIWYAGDAGLSLYDYDANTQRLLLTDVNQLFSLAVGESPTDEVYAVYFANKDSVRCLQLDDDYLHLIMSDDDVESYTNIAGGLPVGSGAGTADLSALVTQPNKANEVLALFDDFTAGEKVYFSDDYGANWTNISGNLPNVPIHCATFDPNNEGGIYLGTAIGVFYRNDNTPDWILYSNNLPRVPVRDIDLVEGNTKLRIGTHGRGIWESEVFSDCPVTTFLTEDPDQEYTANEFYQLSESILSTQEITGGPGTSVTYQAGNFIRLLDGFVVNEECRFDAIIAPCTGQTPDPLANELGEGQLPANFINN